ncbi:MAG: hypothetical protein IJO79_05375 [Firmicutes bacterium]|nr:hypothetical protein [Bacillota bacterium]
MKKVMTGLHKERDLLKEWIRKLESELKDLPEGRLVGRRMDGKTLLYYLRPVPDGDLTLMKKDRLGNRPEERELAGKLKRKALIKKSLPRLKRQLQAVERMLKSWHPLHLEYLEDALPWPYRSLKEEFPCKKLSDLVTEKPSETHPA